MHIFTSEVESEADTVTWHLAAQPYSMDGFSSGVNDSQPLTTKISIHTNLFLLAHIIDEIDRVVGPKDGTGPQVFNYLFV